jgi:hypothetical protein
LIIIIRIITKQYHYWKVENPPLLMLTLADNLLVGVALGPVALDVLNELFGSPPLFETMLECTLDYPVLAAVVLLEEG